MPRTPHEATRFTSTQPNAQSKASSSTIPLPTSAPPPNETPQQKVARLREAARRAKLDQESTFDKIVLRGRVWADRAHRITATGLIGGSIIATGFAALSFGDMIIANRQKKKDWYQQQQDAYDRALAIAKEAEKNGTLTSDLALFLNKERAVEQAEEQERNKPSRWQKAKGTVFGGLKMEGVGSNPESQPIGGFARGPEQDPTEALQSAGQQQVMRIAGQEVPETSNTSPVPKTNAEDSRVVESRARIMGGPLDQMAEQSTSSLLQIASGLLGRFRGN